MSEVMGGRLLLEVHASDEVASFAAALRLAPGEPFHCMCAGDQRLELAGQAVASP